MFDLLISSTIFISFILSTLLHQRDFDYKTNVLEILLTLFTKLRSYFLQATPQK
nr:MAG TPA: hypothetical protein [Caudoviricetes sp.]